MLAPLVGLLLIVIGIPFYLEKVGPNSWSGVRLPKTYSDPRIWYAANKIFGQDMIIAGIALAVSSITIIALAGWYPTLPKTKVNTWLIIVSLGVGVLHTLWSLYRM
jgi:uncharacterized membrane protein